MLIKIAMQTAVSPTQGFFTLTIKNSMKAIHKTLGTSAIALLVANGKSPQATLYCKKGKQSKAEWDELKEKGPNYGLNFVGEEFGKIPTKGQQNDLDQLCDAIQEGKSMLEVSDIHPASYVQNYRGLANLQALHTKPYTHDSCRGIWIWGEPGTGKSTKARSFCSEDDLHIKQQNKWWDGYSGQSYVLLDDLDTPHLGHLLKVWTDKYACSGEIKGGTVALRHTTFIVTSNFTMQELWKEEPKIEAALRHRFKVEHMMEIVDPVVLAELEGKNPQEENPQIHPIFKPCPKSSLEAKTDMRFKNVGNLPRKSYSYKPMTKLPSQKDPDVFFARAWSHISKTASEYNENDNDKNDENREPES
jgi:RNA helicase